MSSERFHACAHGRAVLGELVNDVTPLGRALMRNNCSVAALLLQSKADVEQDFLSVR